jgi:hypothetical protein
MSFILTTIGRDSKIAILECDETPNESKGERRISLDCLLRNIKSGLFIDMTREVNFSGGKVYIHRDDLSA